MTDRELMQQALNALITAEREGNCEYGVTDALRARLAQPTTAPTDNGRYLTGYKAQPEPEPVAHWSDCAVHNEPAYPAGKCDCGGFPIAWFDPKGVALEFDIEDCFSLQQKEGYKPLYTAPPRKEWQGLTGEEIKGLIHLIDWTAGWTFWDFAQAIEAKLKEKNT